MTPPDATSIDWNGIALWAGGISLVAGSVIAAIIRGVQLAYRAAKSMPEPTAAIHKTDVYTTDSLALQRLTNAIEASNALIGEALKLQLTATGLMTEGNALRRDATTERRSLREALDLNTEATEQSVAKLEQLQLEVRDLIKEFVRSQK